MEPQRAPFFTAALHGDQLTKSDDFTRKEFVRHALRLRIVHGSRSGDDIVNHTTGDVGQAKVASGVTVGQFFVIQAHQM